MTMRVLFLGFVMVSLIMVPVAFDYAMADDDLVLYLTFDEGAGENTKDSSGHGNDGVLKGDIQWTDGKYKKAIEPTADGGHVEVNPSDSLEITEQITLMAWINIAAWSGRGDQWIDKAVHPDVIQENSYGMGVYEEDGVVFTLGAGDSHPNISLVEQEKWPPLGVWVHVAATYDGASLKIYYDGEMVGEKAANFPFVGTNDAPVYIGGGYQRPQYTFNGKIDEIAVFKRALTQAEILEAMKGGVSAVSPSGKAATTWSSIKVRY
jgi:hypothetical protein